MCYNTFERKKKREKERGGEGKLYKKKRDKFTNNFIHKQIRMNVIK